MIRGKINPLMTGDIERYVLVSELLGKDLSRALKNASVEHIKNSVILAVKSLHLMHNCDEKYAFLHLGIKHENFVFTDPTETAVKIIDFGSTENLFDRNGERNLKPRKPGEGTPLYMSIMQHKSSIMDYMDDLQAFAWMLLDLLGDRAISIGLPWYSVILSIDRLTLKMEYIENYKNDEYVNKYANGTLTKHNMAVIGELAEYTMKRADKPDKYPTYLKTPERLYYSEYNEQYYEDIINIIKKIT